MKCHFLLIAMLLVCLSVILYGTLKTMGHLHNSNSVHDNSTWVLDLERCQLITQLASGTIGCGTIYFFTIASVLLVTSSCFYVTSKCTRREKEMEVRDELATHYAA